MVAGFLGELREHLGGTFVDLADGRDDEGGEIDDCFVPFLVLVLLRVPHSEHRVALVVNGLVRDGEVQRERFGLVFADVAEHENVWPLVLA